MARFFSPLLLPRPLHWPESLLLRRVCWGWDWACELSLPLFGAKHGPECHSARGSTRPPLPVVAPMRRTFLCSRDCSHRSPFLPFPLSFSRWLGPQVLPAIRDSASHQQGLAVRLSVFIWLQEAHVSLPTRDAALFSVLIWVGLHTGS